MHRSDNQSVNPSIEVNMTFQNSKYQYLHCLFLDVVERDGVKYLSEVTRKAVERIWRREHTPWHRRHLLHRCCIGRPATVPSWRVLCVGRTNDVHRRLVEHKHQYLKIDLYVKEEFEDNGGENLLVNWIKEKNQETKEKEYIERIAHKLGYCWPKCN